MSENQLMLLQDAQNTVTEMLSTKLSKSIRFHTLLHTQQVVSACETIADYQQLADDDDRCALLIAAWFHDTGYTGGKAKDHETLSIQLATDFLQVHQAGEDFVAKVTGCINATRMPQNPQNALEGIICDADLFHLGTDEFKEKNKLLRQEMIAFGEKNVSKDEWRKINIHFLEGHVYFTNYGKDKLQPLKQVHLAELKQKDNGEDMKPDKKEKLKKKQKDIIPLSVKQQQEADKKAKEKAKAEKEKQSERGIATVFRIVAQNQNNLSGRLQKQEQ